MSPQKLSLLNKPTLLENRAILTLSGSDRKSFLQGLITKDVERISGNFAIYAALLTPQGKYLHDFFIIEKDDTIFLDCERTRMADIHRRFMMYRLRADVDIRDCSEKYDVLASPELLSEGLISYPDPRLPNMGFRTIISAPAPYPKDDHYDDLRLSLGLPDGSRDFDVDKTLILEGNMEELNGVDFTKGCYVGQEVTARMKHRAILKKRLLPVTIDGTLPARGTEIIDKDGKKIGDIRSGLGNRAIGYFRLAKMTFNQPYRCGEATITPWQPDWYPETNS
ncbi:tRNA-modifying protein YgfZ [hydrothermal vent metagenome]|uniref:tRNA-modifying protein YgfZ n=1 Tax=hydrothermal vent metagenome TaxID=652676 RepID=A0A3B1BJ02_9ZZZZ